MKTAGEINMRNFNIFSKVTFYYLNILLQDVVFVML